MRFKESKMKEEEAFKLIRGLRNKLLKAEEVAVEKLTRIDTALELVEIVIHCEECIIMGLEKSIVRVREDYSRLGGSKKIIKIRHRFSQIYTDKKKQK